MNKADVYAGHSKQKLMLKMFLEHYCTVYHEFIHEMHNKTKYTDVFHHLEEAIPHKHNHLPEPEKQATSHDNVHAQGSLLVRRI